MSIGLKRGTVKLCKYSDDWPREYEVEKSNLLALAGSSIQRIEHIGSTSVPGLKAKPVIDIAIEVASNDDLVALVDALPIEKYEYFGERDIPDDFFFAKGLEEMRTHYIHVSLSSSPRLADYVKFRNALREDALLRIKYAELKELLASEHQTERKLYTKLKGELVEKVINS